MASALLACRPIRGCVFDMDGTLCRSVINFKRLRQRLSDMGCQPQDDIIHFAHSRPSALLQRAAWDIIEDEEKIGAAQCELSPGLLDVLTYLDRHDIKKAIITRNSEAAVSVFLGILAQHTTSTFELIVTRDFQPVKPSPAPTLHVCQRWGLPPAECIFVGDSSDDMSSGHDAGVGATILLEQAHNEPLRAGHPTVSAVIARLDHLLDVVPFATRHDEGAPGRRATDSRPGQCL